MSVLFFSWFFLIIVLCNSSANSLFAISSFLAVPPDFFLSENFYTNEASPPWYQSSFGFFVILNPLSRNILSEAVLLAKSLKSP